ncbi:MAG: hypothetical protein ACRDKA_03740 [Actinomycetota bacterium]
MAKAWHFLALLHWLRERWADTERALEEAVRHARLAGHRRQEVEDLSQMPAAVSLGPMPVEEAIRRCEEIVARSGGHPKVEARALTIGLTSRPCGGGSKRPGLS